MSAAVSACERIAKMRPNADPLRRSCASVREASGPEDRALALAELGGTLLEEASSEVPNPGHYEEDPAGYLREFGLAMLQIAGEIDACRREAHLRASYRRETRREKALRAGRRAVAEAAKTSEAANVNQPVAAE